MPRFALKKLRSLCVWVRFGLLAVFLLLLFTIIYGVHLSTLVSTMREDFARVQLGQSQETVKNIMGHPDAIRTGPELFHVPAGNEYVGDNKQIESQFVYHIYTPYLPFTWYIGFDRSGVAVEKYVFD